MPNLPYQSYAAELEEWAVDVTKAVVSELLGLDNKQQLIADSRKVVRSAMSDSSGQQMQAFIQNRSAEGMSDDEIAKLVAAHLPRGT